jgi:hypothetical protein
MNQHHAIPQHKENQDPRSRLTVPWGRWYIPNTPSALNSAANIVPTSDILSNIIIE